MESYKAIPETVEEDKNIHELLADSTTDLPLELRHHLYFFLDKHERWALSCTSKPWNDAHKSYLKSYQYKKFIQPTVQFIQQVIKEKGYLIIGDFDFRKGPSWRCPEFCETNIKYWDSDFVLAAFKIQLVCSYKTKLVLIDRSFFNEMPNKQIEIIPLEIDITDNTNDEQVIAVLENSKKNHIMHNIACARLIKIFKMHNPLVEFLEAGCGQYVFSDKKFTWPFFIDQKTPALQASSKIILELLGIAEQRGLIKIHHQNRVEVVQPDNLVEHFEKIVTENIQTVLDKQRKEDEEEKRAENMDFLKFILGTSPGSDYNAETNSRPDKRPRPNY